MEKNPRSTSRNNTNTNHPNSNPKRAANPEISRSNYGVSNGFGAPALNHYQTVASGMGTAGNSTGFNSNATNVRRSNSVNKSGSGRSQNRSSSLTKHHKRDDSQASRRKRSKEQKERQIDSIMDVKLKFDEDTINNSILTSGTG